MTTHNDLSILAIDTATRGCSVALWQDGDVIGSAAEEMERGQSAALMPMIVKVLKESGRDFADLNTFAVTIGPGAFTGLRIGLAAARGMALAANLPVIGVSTLEAVAGAVPEQERQGKTILVALDSKRADHYVQLFSATLEPLGEPQTSLPEDLPKLNFPTGLLPTGLLSNGLLIVGDATSSAVEALSNQKFTVQASAASGLPDAKVIAALAAARWQQGERPQSMPQPLYLRAPDVNMPR
jgi:tRNA threonylcarbamoyladenosine biosynthesis protein TsaB